MNELIQYFESETNVYKNIHSKNKIVFWSLIISPLTFLFYPALINIFHCVIWEYLLLILLILPSLIMFLIFNYKTKKIIKNKYEITIETFLWNGKKTINKINLIEKKKIIEWLKSKDYYDISKLEKIISRFDNIKNKKHLKFPVFPAVIGVLLFPLWQKYIDILFIEFTSSEYHILLLKYITLIIFLISFILFCIFGIKKLLEVFWENVINSDTKNIERLIVMLNEVIFDLEISKYNDT